MRASIVFYPNEKKLSAKTRKVPLYLRVILNGKKAETRLNKDLTQVDLLKWERETMRIKGQSHVNSYINSLSSKFDSFLNMNETNLHLFTAKAILAEVMNKTRPVSPAVISYVDQYYESVIKPSDREAGTKRCYVKAINHLKKFMKKNNKEDLLVYQLDVKFAYAFKDYLLSEDSSIEKEVLRESSASGIVKKFKTIFTRAVDEELLPNNPFKRIKLSDKSQVKERLTASQVRSLFRLGLTNFRTQAVYRDLFLFSVFTGLAYSDAQALAPKNLQFREDGLVKMRLLREKTGEEVEMFLVPQAVEIINRYMNTPESRITGRVLPQRSNPKFNVQLKMISEMVNNPFPLTTHIGRHTFRQLLSEAGIEDAGLIKRMMGHSREGDIDAVYYLITEERLIEAKRKYEVFLQKYL